MSIEVSNLDHLGLVAGLIDEIGIVPKINDFLGEHHGDVPLWMRIGDGNESDRQQFAQIMREFKSQLKWDSLRVLDSAFYSQENLQSSQSIWWLSRVPLTVKAAGELVRDVSDEALMPSQLTGYRYQEIQKTYGGINQRWLVVESQKRRESDLNKFAKNVQKEAVEAAKQLQQLSRQPTICLYSRCPRSRPEAFEEVEVSSNHEY